MRAGCTAIAGVTSLRLGRGRESKGPARQRDWDVDKRVFITILPSLWSSGCCREK